MIDSSDASEIEIVIPEGITLRINALSVEALKAAGSQLYWGPPKPRPERSTGKVKILARTADEFSLALQGKGQVLEE